MNIPDLLGSLVAAQSLVGSIFKERDSQKAAAIKADLTEKLLTAQAQLSEILATVIEQQGRIAVLEQRRRDLEAEKAEKARYLLAKVGTVGQFFAYRLRDASELTERSDEVPHFVCQPCFELGKKNVLRGNGGGFWSCPVCKHGASTEPGGIVIESIPRRGGIDWSGY